MRELVSYITGLILVLSGVVLLGLRVITFENTLILVGIGLGVMGFGQFTPRDTEKQLNRLMYKFRHLEPVLSFENQKLVVSVLEGTVPDKFVKELGKLLYGWNIVVKTHKPLKLLDVKEGGGIRPRNKNWVGSLGYYYRGYFTTNAHVVPEVGMDVLEEKTGELIGRSVWVSNIKTISYLDIILSYLFGRPLPSNKTDAALIKPAHDLRWAKFQDYHDILEENINTGDSVVSSGRTSGLRTGLVKSVSTSAILLWPHNRRYALFTDVVGVEMPSRPGDSGSPVIMEVNRTIAGIVFAGTEDGSLSLVVKAGNIEKEAGEKYK